MGGVGRRVARRVAAGIGLAAVVAGCAGGSGATVAPSAGLSAGPSGGAGAAAAAPSAAAPTAAPSAVPATPSPSPEPVGPSPTPGLLAGFSVRPFGLSVASVAYFAVDADGNVYLPGGTLEAAVVKMRPDGSVGALWGGLDVVPGQPDTVAGIAVDPASGDVWVADQSADTIVRLDPLDLSVKAAFGATGTGDGQFTSPGGLAIDPRGRVVVVDIGGDRLETFTPDGGFVSETRRPAGLAYLVDVSIDGAGNRYLSAAQPNTDGFLGGRGAKLTAKGALAWPLAMIGGKAATFPDLAAGADGRVYVVDGWEGLSAVDPANGTTTSLGYVPGSGDAPIAVRVSPTGDVYTLACKRESTDCMLASFTAAGQPTQTWHFTASPTRPGRTVDAEGARIYLHCTGDANGGPTIVWSGGGSGSGTFETQGYLLGRLATVGRVCTYDRAGLGASPSAGFREGTHWEATVRQLHAALAAAGEPGPYVIAGYSYGGMIGRLFALQYPGEVVGMVSVDGSAEPWYDHDYVLRDFGGTWPCDSDACSLYPDLQYARSLSGWRVPGSLGSMPLVVIAHDPAWTSFGDADPAWLDMVTVSAQASSNSVLVTASLASHAVGSIRPGLVVEAVRAVVAAARTTDHALAPCGAAFEAVGGVCR